MQQNIVQEEKDNNLFSVLLTYLLKGMCFCFKFGVYLIIEFLQMIINFIYDLMDFDNWNFLNKRNEDRLLEVEVLEGSSKHEYVVKRGAAYDNMYESIENLLQVDSSKQKIIDNIVADDILKKIDIIVYESEKNALQQGYKFARETKYILQDGEIYESYIKSRVMRGE